jgi:hypothetical protein
MTATEVIVIGLGTPQSAGENIECTWEHLGALAIILGTPMTSRVVSGSTGDTPWSAGDKCWTISNHSRAVWEKQHLL